MVSVRAKSLGIRIIGSVLGLAVVSLLITLQISKFQHPLPTPPFVGYTYLIREMLIFGLSDPD
jgi:O-antigen/teichoic acid export membrane protein